MLQRNMTDEELSISASEAGLWSVTSPLSNPTQRESREEEIKNELHFYLFLFIKTWLLSYYQIQTPSLTPSGHFSHPQWKQAPLFSWPSMLSDTSGELLHFKQLILARCIKGSFVCPPLQAQNNFLSCWCCLVFCRARVVKGWDKKKN